MAAPVSFLVFFPALGQAPALEVPDIHVRAVVWLESRGPLAVLRCFRGSASPRSWRSTTPGRYYGDPTYRILHQSEADGTAYKTSRDTQNALRNHPHAGPVAPRAGHRGAMVGGGDRPTPAMPACTPRASCRTSPARAPTRPRTMTWRCRATSRRPRPGEAALPAGRADPHPRAGWPHALHRHPAHPRFPL